ncbi:hypothetical protein GCM10008015_06820 [Flavobacterium palustre]|uniref:Peptidyl-prolyl cis-trans isomerase n=1 Tax=Flavobacterium palustre TaxID=1476463 RepID=A0ABQ1HAW1_9FLAO|nr:FKBP-type peptidyl-prolyl cis-trans isomerase [Flavobacterium palustre]GGA68672.1 hypothetical protein GCM10008015_06820 [Flavobacterium palustre]
MKYSFLFLLTVLFTSCINNDIEPQVAKDYTVENETEIIDYIEENDLNATRTSSGLYYVIDEEGTGERPTTTSNVTVAYKGYFTDKVVFDQSSEAGVSFNLNGVIKGWVEGIPLFKEGGSGILLIPAHLGYGSFNYYGIPGGSVLIFNIKLISVN